MFFKTLKLCRFLSLEECSLHVNGVEINKDFNGYQYTLLVVSIPTKNGQSKKEQISL